MSLFAKYSRALCPFPTIDPDGSLRSGTRLGQCRVCRECKSKDCREFTKYGKADTVQHVVCPVGLSVFVFSSDSEITIANGMLEPERNSKCRPRDRRTLRRTHAIRIDQAEEWQAVIRRVVKNIASDIDSGPKESIASLHDIKTAVGVVYRNAEGLVAAYPGHSFDEKVENAEPELKSLLKAVGLLSTRMSMASIVANPESASFGQKKPTPVYKIFDKMVHLFEELAYRKKLRIRISGSSFRTPSAYESLESLALVLVDNAVKYCVAGDEVVVRVNDAADHPGEVFVEVDSVGPLVPEDKRKEIFEKGYRAPNAKRLSPAGSGLGLYIAKVVAQAHGFEIQYRCAPSPGCQEMGHNIFSFRIR